VETLTAENAEINQRLRVKQEEAEAAAKAHSEASAAATTLHRAVREIAEAQDEELNDVAREVADMASPEKLEADIESAYATLEIVSGGQQGNVMRDWERRQKEIEQLTGRIEEATAELDGIAHGINDCRGRWEPELDALAERISDGFGHNMAQIGCAGQVSIYKADDEPTEDEDEISDFEKWGIHIRVKFREHESLQLLTAHRQSGGERSVSTIFYLMALQSLSASPFRVVDEINQGMDPRNERKVHERMVDIACDRGGSQYFLITPKLLAGLKYKPGMNVHCIVSGEFVPEDGSALDFGRCVEKMRQVKAVRGVGVGA
jgi:structural maintenance of chromosomes protein 5